MDQDLLSIQEVRTKVTLAWAAWRKYRSYTQEQVDSIVEAMAAAGRAQARPLAELAVAETGYGNVRDKIAKNLLCSDVLPRQMRGMKTIGVIREIPEQQVVEIGCPMGVVAAILPTTNPTSTAIFKCLIALKSGNAIVLSPHPRAKKCTCETADLMLRAAIQAGAPADIIQCITNPTMEATSALMRHEHTGVILSTGGAGIVKAAYSSGKPAFGVGPGNVPVLVERSADIADAVAKVVEGKSFDYGTVCSSEQSMVAERGLREPIVQALKRQNAHFCTAEQARAVEKILFTPQFTVTAECVGQSPRRIAELAGFTVPETTSILVAEIQGVGKQHPLSAEKLSPVLSLLFVDDWNAALGACESILNFGGRGHTCVIYSKDEARIREFALRMPAYRVLVNTPAPQGSTGITTNVFPSMTLGCGAMAGNVTSDNVGPRHLMNIKRLAYAVRKPQEAFEVDLAAAETGESPAAPLPVDRAAIVSAVERYLAQRGVGAAKPAAPAASLAALAPMIASAPQHTCGCRHAAAAEAPAPAPAPAPVAIADFVCEEDVRKAVRDKQKIFIGPKTIVTPSARDASAEHDTLVMAQRS